MKIVIVNTLYYPYKIGGAERSVQLLAEELVRHQHEVTVICLHEFNVIKEDIVNGVKVYYLPIRNIYWPFDGKPRSLMKKVVWHTIDYFNFLASRDVERLLLKIKPDVVHTNNLSGFSISIWSLANKLKLMLIHTSRDYYLFHPLSTLFDSKKEKNISPRGFFVKLWSFFRKRQSRKVNCYVGISNFISDFHVENGFFPNSNHAVIYNSVNPCFKSDINNKKNVNYFTVGFIGTLTKNKGFFDFCNIALKFPEVNFVAAGRFTSDVDENEFKNRFSNKNISLLGHIEFSDFADIVDSVILPVQWNEPFGRTVVECALSGIVVYVSPVGGIKELINKVYNVYPLESFSGNKKNNTMENSVNIISFTSENIAMKYLENYSGVSK
ncbi:glycosyltransferase [Aeromonas media]|uniref:glycosyltransferase n=1 Tax=Aeromonas media TaxID=651 RepID=UPI0038D062FF